MDDRISVTSIVFFDGRFRVCVGERHEGGRYPLARHAFGSEPSNPTLREFMLGELHALPFREGGAGVPDKQVKTYSFKKSLHKARNAQRMLDPGKNSHAAKRSHAAQAAREGSRLSGRRADG